MADFNEILTWAAVGALGLVAYKTYRLATVQTPTPSPSHPLATKHERFISAKEARNFANGSKQPILYYEHIFGNSYMIHTGHFKYYVNTPDIEEYVRKRYYLKSADVPDTAHVPRVVDQANFKS